MFDRVMQWLETPSDNKTEGFTQADIRLCIAALFYRMIVVDGLIRPEETTRLADLLRERFDVDDEQLAKLTDAGREAGTRNGGLFAFTVVLNRELSEAERLTVLAQLESLARADGSLHERELELLSNLRELLHLS